MNEVQKKLYSTRGVLKCYECDSVDLKVNVGYDGLTTHPYELYITCQKCGYVTPIARLKTDRDLEVKDKVNLII